MQRKKVVFCWSGGKDSALALNRLMKDERYEVVCLLTTCNEHFQRVSMHGVRIELVEKQAEEIGLPLEKVFLGKQSSNKEYIERMSEKLLALKSKGIHYCAFGDIFLEDLREWREKNLAKIGMQAIFPIWKEASSKLIKEFFDLGFRATICCVNDAYLGEEAIGHDIDVE